MTYAKTSAFYSLCAKKSSEPIPPSDPAVGWHPGIHIFPSYNSTNNIIPSGQWTNIKAELAAFKAFRGVQLRFHWPNCEIAKDVYDFSLLEDYLKEIAQVSSGASRKYGFAMVHIRHSATGGPPVAMDMVPAYMRPYDATNNPTGDPGGATYGGGQWYFASENPLVPGAGGKLICWWNPNVRARAAKFAEALGAYLDNYLALEKDSITIKYKVLEGITISESATGAPHPTVPQPAGVTFPTYWEEKYFEGYYLFEVALRAAFKRTIVGAFTNFSREAIAVMIDGGAFYPGGPTHQGMKAIGCAIGNPNTLADERPLNRGPEGSGNSYEPPGIYWYYARDKGIIPITCSWQPPDYMCTALGGKIEAGAPVCRTGSHHPTVEERYLFTKNNLNATHLFATRTTDLTYWADFKNYLTSTGLKDSVTGGLNSAPPTCYPNVDIT